MCSKLESCSPIGKRKSLDYGLTLDHNTCPPYFSIQNRIFSKLEMSHVHLTPFYLLSPGFHLISHNMSTHISIKTSLNKFPFVSMTCVLIFTFTFASYNNTPTYKDNKCKTRQLGFMTSPFVSYLLLFDGQGKGQQLPTIISEK